MNGNQRHNRGGLTLGRDASGGGDALVVGPKDARTTRQGRGGRVGLGLLKVDDQRTRAIRDTIEYSKLESNQTSAWTVGSLL